MKREKNIKNDKTKKSGLGTKIILRIVTILIVALIFLAGGYFINKKYFSPKKENTHALIEKQLSFCQELVTAKYRYSDIISLKKSSGFAKSYSIIKYSGILKCGIEELTDVDFRFDEFKKTIYIRLPQPEVIGNELTKLEIFDEKQSIFVPITTQEIFDEIENAKNEIAADLLADGILEDSKDYAQRIISQFMNSLGFENVIFEE
ncbi:MAG: DUF4230 domain-containing protein [Treponema sp.]|nr:DUF4230 domain-containing protein [Spirochaetia bacterium]MDY2840419.1 DUF4230 domain-containing protein [Treponema sp.]